MTDADAVVRDLANRRRAFTTDDAWEHLAVSSDGRAIANAVIRAERDGLIVNSRVGAYLRGRQAHRRWLTVWLSGPLGASIDDAVLYVADAVRNDTPSSKGSR